VRVHFAINNGDVEELRRLAWSGRNLDWIIHGNTPLTLAIIKEQYDMVPILLEAGADPNVPEKTKWLRLPLHLAAKDGRTEVVKELLSNGAKSSATDSTFMTGLHWAAIGGHISAAKLLVEHGCPLNVRDDVGRTALHRAAEGNFLELMRYLCMAGADINVQDSYGWSPLFQAVVCNQFEVVQELVQMGADCTIQDKMEETVLHKNAFRLRRENFWPMIKTEPNIYTRDKRIVNHAVHKAVQTTGNELAIGLILLDFGAKPQAQNHQGDSAVSLCAKTGNVALLELLVKAGATLQYEHWLYEAQWPEKLQDHREVCEWLKNLITVVSPLKDLCKISARNALGRDISRKIEHLPIPKTLKFFLHI
jgi:ankyrin repeat protein